MHRNSLGHRQVQIYDGFLCRAVGGAHVVAAAQVHCGKCRLQKLRSCISVEIQRKRGVKMWIPRVKKFG